ncbi:UNVERIFIED_CONTAM: hypothetical protein Sradi_0711200 [Sesamum radiatum]|uniref:Uncharacterized protein n=1 Tax=Sesamum radiatum TaxID=300843 RepID=A0AAW2VNK9_SESRA
MSSIDESVHYVEESRDDDPSEATSRMSGSPMPSYVVGWWWSLCQAVRRLLDESSKEEEDMVEEEGSSLREREPPPRGERVSSGNCGGRLEGLTWVACGLRQSDIYKLVEEFAFTPEYVVSLPPPNSHPSSPLSGYMSFFISQLRAKLRFPIPSFFRKASRNLRVPLNQLKDGAHGHAIDILKGALPARDKKLLSSLSSEDLDLMLTLVLTKVRLFTRHSYEGRWPSSIQRIMGVLQSLLFNEMGWISSGIRG